MPDAPAPGDWGGWDAIDDVVARMRAEIAASAPDAATAEEGDAYLLRVLTTCLTDAFLGHLMTDGGLSRALPTRGGPNPDYRMAFAPLDPARSYRLEGWLNGSERVGIGTYAFGAGGASEVSSYAAFDVATVDGEGHFSLDLAAGIGGPGTLPILPGARAIMTRVLHRDPDAAPARLILHGAQPVRDLAVTRGSVEGALRHVAGALEASIRTFLEWTATTGAARNRFHADPPAMAQDVTGDPDTRYFLGSYDLGEGEWLEVAIPPGTTGYWSLHAYNHWCEALPGAGIGDDRAVAEPDGRVIVAIGPSTWGDRGNRIDTIGRRRGALICRMIGGAGWDAPETAVRRQADDRR